MINVPVPGRKGAHDNWLALPNYTYSFTLSCQVLAHASKYANRRRIGYRVSRIKIAEEEKSKQLKTYQPPAWIPIARHATTFRH
jgi:hypothetical protein